METTAGSHGSLPFLTFLRIAARLIVKSSADPLRMAEIRSDSEEGGISPEEYKLSQYNIVRDTNIYSYPSGSGTVWKIIYFIHLHYSEDITIKSASAYFHFSASYLNNLLKRHTGQNFTDLLSEIRILNACTLLASTDLSICEIAFEVGYDSKETFFRNFRKLKRISPGDYRRRSKTGNTDIKMIVQ